MKAYLIIITAILNLSYNLCLVQNSSPDKIEYQLSTNIISYEGNNIKDINSCELGRNKIGESYWNVSKKIYDSNDLTEQQLDIIFN